MMKTFGLMRQLIVGVFLSLWLWLALCRAAVAEELPTVTERLPASVPHFPDLLHAVVWRNWGLVESARLATMLAASVDKLSELAASMGLPRRVTVTSAMRQQEVAEAPTPPLSLEGFIAWAEARVGENPACEGSTNTIELELAGALHQVQLERLHDLSTLELRSWLADIFWVGHAGHTEKTREALLQEIEAEIIDLAEDEFDTVEDALD